VTIARSGLLSWTITGAGVATTGVSECFGVELQAVRPKPVIIIARSLIVIADHLTDIQLQQPVRLRQLKLFVSQLRGEAVSQLPLLALAVTGLQKHLLTDLCQLLALFCTGLFLSGQCDMAFRFRIRMAGVISGAV